MNNLTMSLDLWRGGVARKRHQGRRLYRSLSAECLEPRLALASVHFVAHAPLAVGGDFAAKSVYAGDLDGDGDPDVLSGLAKPAFAESKVIWFENIDGKGGFGTQKLITGNARQIKSVTAVDMDGDADMDVLLGSDGDSGTVWYQNSDGKGKFDPPKVVGTGEQAYAVDLDGDEDVDVVAGSADSGSAFEHLNWYKNTSGDGSFGNAERISIGFSARVRSVHAADMDGDGDNDILIAQSNVNAIAWYENANGQGAFGNQKIITDKAVSAWSAFAADVDGDGDMDVLSASSGDNKIAWYENINGRGTSWAEKVITQAADGARSVYALDLDGDGDTDVLSASSADNKIAWYENTDGTGKFGEQKVITESAAGAGSVYAADLDGDRDIDVLSASQSDGKIVWYEQRPEIDPPVSLISSVTPDPRRQGVNDITITFRERDSGKSEQVENFEITDLTLTRDGGANLLPGAANLATADKISWTLGNLGGLTGADGTYELRVVARGSGVEDLAGNPLASDSVETFTVDTHAPTADIRDVMPDPRNQRVNAVTIVFNEQVRNFDLSDLVLMRGGGRNLIPGAATLTTQDNINWTLGNLDGLTAEHGTHELRLDAPGSGITDLAGNLMVTGASETWIVDIVPPTVDVRDVAPDPRDEPVSAVTVTFSEPVRNFDLADLTLTRDGGANLLSNATPRPSLTPTDNTNTIFTLGNLAGLTARDGTYQLNVVAANSGIADAVGNLLLEGAIERWTVETQPVTADIRDVAPDPHPQPINQITIVFSESVLNFDRSDLRLTRDGVPIALANQPEPASADRITWTWSNLAGLTGRNGTYQLRLVAANSRIIDLVGNPLEQDAIETWSGNIPLPTADIIDVTPDPRYELEPVREIVIVFSTAVQNFDAGDLILTRDGNVLRGLPNPTSTDGTTWTLRNLDAITATPGTYQLRLTAANSGITDVYGNAMSQNAVESWTVVPKPVGTVEPVFKVVNFNLAAEITGNTTRVNERESPDFEDYRSTFSGQFNGTGTLTFTSPTAGSGNAQFVSAGSGEERFRKDNGGFRSNPFTYSFAEDYVLTVNGGTSITASNVKRMAVDTDRWLEVFFDFDRVAGQEEENPFSHLDLSWDPTKAAMNLSGGSSFSARTPEDISRTTSALVTGTLSDTTAEVLDIRPTSVGLAPDVSRVDFSFVVTGSVHPTPDPQTPVSSVELFYASSPNPRDILEPVPIAPISIYWNQAGATVNVTGLLAPLSGATHVLVFTDRNNRLAESDETNNVLAIPIDGHVSRIEAGDANRDGRFDQLDIVQVLQSAKYLTGQPATWEQGDWNEDGLFDQKDIVLALQTGRYLQGPRMVSRPNSDSASALSKREHLVDLALEGDPFAWSGLPGEL